MNKKGGNKAAGLTKQGRKPVLVGAGGAKQPQRESDEAGIMKQFEDVCHLTE